MGPGVTNAQQQAVAIPAVRLNRLRAYNVAMGALHAVQAIIILALATDFALPVTATFLDGPPGTEPTASTDLFTVRVASGVALFLFLSAVAHWTIALPGRFDRYGRGLSQHHNYARWLEYSVSASVMIVLIAMLTGISDIAALTALFGVNASMILFGWLQERYEQPGRPSFLPFWFGAIAGIVPWVAIGIYLVSPGNDASPPGFVYAIFGSLFIFFNIFAVNMILQYRRVGPWRDYVFGESVYVALSLVAKSALAWQVFAGTLAS
jgi:Heliorhodopsin